MLLTSFVLAALVFLSLIFINLRYIVSNGKEKSKSRVRSCFNRLQIDSVKTLHTGIVYFWGGKSQGVEKFFSFYPIFIVLDPPLNWTFWVLDIQEMGISQKTEI